MGDWTSDETASVKDGCASYCTAHLWIVPAKVEGTWQLPEGELALKQTYQMISGTLKRGNNAIQIANGKLQGDQITFNAGNRCIPVESTGMAWKETSAAAVTGRRRAPGNNGSFHDARRAAAKRRHPSLCDSWRYLIRSNFLALPSSISSMSDSEMSSCETFFAASQSPRS